MAEGCLQVELRFDRELVVSGIQGDIFDGGIAEDKISAFDVENQGADVKGQH